MNIKTNNDLQTMTEILRWSWKLERSFFIQFTNKRFLQNYSYEMKESFENFSNEITKLERGKEKVKNKTHHSLLTPELRYYCWFHRNQIAHQNAQTASSDFKLGWTKCNICICTTAFSQHYFWYLPFQHPDFPFAAFFRRYFNCTSILKIIYKFSYNFSNKKSKQRRTHKFEPPVP